MKIITKSFLVAFSCATCFFSLDGIAQNPTSCGTTQMHLKLMETDPVYKKNYLAEQSRLEMIDKAEFANGYKAVSKPSSTSATPPLYIIPVVFHIIHQYGAENISDAQIKDAIRTLNEDFRKRNADTAQTVAEFRPIAADCEIEFRLAQLDPFGQPTNGIERIASPYTNKGNDTAKLNPWPRNMYLNIWVVKFVPGGFAAFATYPGGAPEKDGILALHTYIGAIGTSQLLNSHTLSHEAAHYLNIQHVWGNTNAPEVNCGDDLVSDTPITKGHNNKCPLTDQTCTPGTNENVQNFMEYSYCFTMFTKGQKTRMHAALNGTASDRNNLWTVNNLIATGITTVPKLAKADFQSNNVDNVVCQGGNLKFTDYSWNGRPTSWNWAFEGGTPATSTDSIPVVTYPNAGRYDVQLTVSNSTGTVSATKKDFITVEPVTGYSNKPYFSEGFETDTIPNADWEVRFNAPGNNWKRTNLAALNGTYSAMIHNTTESNTFVNELVAPAVDMTVITGPNLVLAFDVAYAKRVSSSDDKLQIYVSSDCGKNWSMRKLITSLKMSNGLIETGNFIPNSSQWTQQTVPLTSYASCKNLLCKFTFTSNGGNNVYIDNINITGSLGIKEEFANHLNMMVYPNPMNDNSRVSFELEQKEQVTISIQDVVGRTVSTVFTGIAGAGHHEYPVAGNSKLSAGIYFVNFTDSKHTVSEKLIIN
jgi:PKD repeat protein